MHEQLNAAFFQLFMTGIYCLHKAVIPCVKDRTAPHDIPKNAGLTIVEGHSWQ